MMRVHLDLGSNVDPGRNIEQGLALLRAAFPVTGVSGVYASAAFGPPGQPPFHNVAVAIDTELRPADLRVALRRIEAQAGRVRSADKFAPRCLDIDIVLYGDLVVDGQIPHPQLYTQPFVLVPLAELAPEVIEPLTGRTLAELLTEHTDFRTAIIRLCPD